MYTWSMNAPHISAAYTKAADHILAQVREEVAAITAAARAISQEAKKEKESSALAALRAKLFDTRP